MNNNISIIGIGKLGLCFALTLENQGYNVVGVDMNEKYIQKINDKILYSVEPGVVAYLNQSKNLTVTTDIKKGLDHSDMLFLFVATPSLSNGCYDHSQIDRVIKQLIQYECPKQLKHLVICCTTMPGYCDSVQKKLLPYGYNISYNPEFIAQGSVMKDLVNPDILLIGTGDKSCAEEIEELYASILSNKPSVHRMSLKEAEITKIALNCFLTTKIAYANMVGDIAKLAGCSPDLILKAVGSDSRIGIDNLKYGYGFGGPCFPRDNRAFALFADDVGVDAVLSKSSDYANSLHLKFQLKEFIENNDISKKVELSDLAYKPGTTIIEESQKLAFAVALAKRGYHITIKDKEEVIKQINLIYSDLFQYIKI